MSCRGIARLSLLSFENLNFGVDFLVNLLKDYSHKGEGEREREIVD
jgi:hypothetical protein